MNIFRFFRLDLKAVEAVVDAAIRTVVRFVTQAQKEIDKQQTRIEKAALKAGKFADEKGTAERILKQLGEIELDTK